MISKIENSIEKTIVYLCVENELFCNYLETSFLSNDYNVTVVNREKIYKITNLLSNGILILQSDDNEIEMIELTKKLKRLFGYDIKILFLSTDYKIFQEVENTVDKTLLCPIEFEEIEQSIIRIADVTKKILLIDDSKLVHQHLVPSLKSEGYEVYEAFDGLQGLDLSKKCQPDLIICDIEMPGLNGFEVCSAIRETPEISETYIIMSSTLGSASDIQKGFRSGVDEYIIKPVVVEELLDRIQKVFKQTLIGRENILILEPDEILSQNMSRSLRKQGFSTRTVETVADALSQLTKYTYELVVLEMDINSKETAVDFLLAIKNWKAEKKPSMILLTSRDSQSDVKMVMNMGISSVISRPFSMDTLLAATERVLADRRSAAEKVQLLRYMSKSSIRMASEKAMLEGEGSVVRADKKFVSLFFGDIVNFTSRCEQYQPKEVVEQINQVFAMITQVTHQLEGDVDKFMGDACMLFWYETDEISAATKMINAAFEIRKRLNEMNLSNPLLLNDPIFLRIGMNSGDAILCDIGSADSRLDLTLIGDNVNLTSRLEAAGKQYGVDTIISESSYNLVKNLILVRELDFVKVVGKSKPVVIYDLVDRANSQNNQLISLVEQFTKGIELYKKGFFFDAKQMFLSTLNLEPERKYLKTNPSKVYIKRCDYLLENPPEFWEGIWTLTEK
jgi:DNA-binding response OmpR family regulator